ncbi:hypothetical protein L873DRAFT_1360780 [Choiromyces venosus 120613-1]|uniref:Uncharacterized protein n=1 Tax=Choiromyces venosus 120613-1 TaxID=1336337 RepID=A0A3N4K1Q2_9PEZI|nr:hypothetical protein L873DRAFT_1360780 [Choiromyces venosus 120613-1]
MVKFCLITKIICFISFIVCKSCRMILIPGWNTHTCTLMFDRFNGNGIILITYYLATLARCRVEMSWD